MIRTSEPSSYSRAPRRRPGLRFRSPRGVPGPFPGPVPATCPAPGRRSGCRGGCPTPTGWPDPGTRFWLISSRSIPTLSAWRELPVRLGRLEVVVLRERPSPINLRGLPRSLPDQHVVMSRLFTSLENSVLVQVAEVRRADVHIALHRGKVARLLVRHDAHLHVVDIGELVALGIDHRVIGIPFPTTLPLFRRPLSPPQGERAGGNGSADQLVAISQVGPRLSRRRVRVMPLEIMRRPGIPLQRLQNLARPGTPGGVYAERVIVGFRYDEVLPEAAGGRGNVLPGICLRGCTSFRRATEYPPTSVD